MNRTIKFRGKTVNDNKWVYGDLFHIAGGYIIYHGSQKDCEITTGKHVAVELLHDEISVVVPETVGQFTGLFDKNGKEIYGGDIVQLDYITTIGKHRIGLSFEVKWCTQEGCWVGWDGFVENALQQTCKMFVVKGNIYDNPELMKEEL
ncbi:YopX family protein [Bacteroides fragilis]